MRVRRHPKVLIQGKLAKKCGKSIRTFQNGDLGEKLFFLEFEERFLIDFFGNKHIPTFLWQTIS
jgi:hypothetical protein